MTMRADEFKAIRLANNLTQGQLADRMEKRRGSIIRYENGEPIPFLVASYMRELARKTVFVVCAHEFSGEMDHVSKIFHSEPMADLYALMAELKGEHAYKIYEVELMK